jgi:hypothetical protein
VTRSSPFSPVGLGSLLVLLPQAVTKPELRAIAPYCSNRRRVKAESFNGDIGLIHEKLEDFECNGSIGQPWSALPLEF